MIHHQIGCLRTWSLCLFLLLGTAAPLWSQEEGFRVSGDIRFSGSGDLFVRMLTRQQLEKETESKIRARLPLTEQELAAGKKAFSFENVPQGTYCIQVYQDANANGKMDKGMFGPKEPWGVYRHSRPRFRAPKFDEMAFDVDKDAEGISIDVK